MKKNNGFLVFIVVFLILLAGVFLIKSSNPSGNVSSNSGDSENYQKIVIGFKNYNYYPNTIKIKVNEPVRVYIDESVRGCYRSFTIRELGISKYLATEKDYVEFTPTKKGNLRFSCSMGMGTGTFIVE